MSKSQKSKKIAERKQDAYRASFRHEAFDKSVVVPDEEFKPRTITVKAWRAVPQGAGRSLSQLVRRIQQQPLAPLSPEDHVVWAQYTRNTDTRPVRHPQFDCEEVWDLGNERQREVAWREVRRTSQVWMEQQRRGVRAR